LISALYSVLNDLVELSAAPDAARLRNQALRKELEVLSRNISPAWIADAVRGVDQLHSNMRRNINRQLSLDALGVNLAANSA